MASSSPVGKSPISVLQELAAAKKISNPEYSVTQSSSGFKCEVKVGNISVHAVASNKKVAKHLSAAEMLERLVPQSSSQASFDTGKSSLVEDECVGNSITIPVESISAGNATAEESVHPVNQLQEICGKMKIDVPVYIDKGSNENNKTFICECRCFIYNTVGIGSSKKEARRLAALAMMDKEAFNSEAIRPPSPVPVASDVGKSKTDVDEMFKNMESEFRKFGLNGHLRSTVHTSNNTAKKVECSDNYEHDILAAQLLSFGYSYDLLTVQEVPLILALKATNVEDGDEQTFVRMCETTEVGTTDLLKLAIEAIKVVKV